jgi:hypothetical protein
VNAITENKKLSGNEEGVSPEFEIKNFPPFAENDGPHPGEVDQVTEGAEKIIMKMEGRTVEEIPERSAEQDKEKKSHRKVRRVFHEPVFHGSGVHAEMISDSAVFGSCLTPAY